MAVTFTPDQQKVIDLRDRNILVSAAAGSGKTAVLVERIIQMISDEKNKVDIDRLLVVTFTNAAAAEMRERISLAIGKRLEQEPENRHLQRQAALLHNALITTIDSFCLFVIRNNFNDIGLDPGFRISDEGELQLLKQDVLTELLERKYEEGEEGFLNCVEYFTGGSSDKALEEYIEKLYEFSMSCPWPEEWLLERREDYKITSVSEMEERTFCRYLTGYLQKAFAECAERLKEAAALSEKPAGPYFYGALLEQEEEMLRQLSEKESLQAFYEGCEKAVFGRLPGKKDDSVSAELREKAKEIRNGVKKQVEQLKEAYLALSPEQLLVRMQKAKEPVEELLSLTLQFKEMLDERKRRENILDFHDMEHMALQILLKKKEDGSGEYEAAPAALEYRQHFYEILIDEYQDSNLVQELLLKSISGEEEGRFNRFMVGDVKQSIYKFRLARPELFIEKYNCYSKLDSTRQRIDLRKNFRSRKEVLDSVNRLFYRIMGKELGGVSYDEEAALYPGAVYPETEANETRTLLIEKDEESPLSAREQEAFAVALQIKELIREFQVTDRETGSLRPARYSDIVILLRTASGWAEDFKKILEREGIPAYVASRTGYFQAVEVRELLQLLHVVDNPLQDIPLYGVLKSFFGKFSEEEIALIRSGGRRGSLLYEDLQRLAETGEGAGGLKIRTTGFLKYLSELRSRASYTPIHSLIQDILTETGYLTYITAKPGGKQRRANVEMLLVRAAAFEKTSYYGLFHFLRYINQLEKYQVDYGEADILDENANVVRLMSIHKSKGLEFPICFVSGLAKKFNMQDTTGRLIVDADMGLGVDFIDNERRIRSKTLRKNAVAMKLRLDSLGEELRVLYVAMTRAKEKLFLTALVSDQEKRKEELCGHQEEGKVSFLTLAGAGSFLDFVFPCLTEEQVEWRSAGALLEKQVQDVLRLSEVKQSLRKAVLSDSDNEIMTIVSEKFKRTYPYSYLKELFVKTTVSELKKGGQSILPDKSMGGEIAGEGERSLIGEQAFTQRLYEEPEIVPYIPDFIQEKEGMSGADRGSAYHKVMELLQFGLFSEMDGKAMEEELNRQMDEMVQSERLSQRWRNSVSQDKLLTFLQTGLAGRMIQADKRGKLYRERPFVLGLPSSRINHDFPDTELVLIQGIIDVYFEEDGRLVVADYKTDRVKEKSELIKRYQVQLDYYGEALFQLTEKEVKEKRIYSFGLGEEILL